MKDPPVPRVVPRMNTTIPYPERQNLSPPLQRLPNGPSDAPENFVTRHPAPSALVERQAVAQPATVAAANSRRRLLFRGVRIVLTTAVLAGTGSYVRHIVTSVTSDQAYINAEMTPLRAPIEGELHLESLHPGAVISQGANVFTIQNPRFGNQEVNGQLNWLRELIERLRAEADDARVLCQQQEQTYRVYEKLHQEKLISDLEFIAEQTKLAVAKSTLTNKQVQARQAEARAHEIDTQVDLQKQAIVSMPFDAVVWAVPAKPGAQVAAHEPILHVIDPHRIWVDAFFHEKHANKLRPGVAVRIRALDGQESWSGRIESIRAGVGRIAYDAFPAGLQGDYGNRRVAVRVTMNSKNPFDASQFFGVGRSVVVSIADHE